MTQSASVPFRPRFDRGRIAAETGTIAINTVLLLALLAPVVPPAFEPPKRNMEIVIVPSIEKPRPVPPPAVPVLEPPSRVAPAPAVVQPQPRRIEEPAVVVEGVGEPLAPSMEPARMVADGVGNSIPPPPGPLAGAHLRYASAPAPAYPREALRDGATGTVWLDVLVDIDGRPLDVTVARSSGRRDLDQAARRQVLRRWRFVPAMDGGRAVQAVGRVPVEFALER